MLSDILKSSTHQSHAALEKQLIGQIKSTHNVESYARLLRLMFGYYQPAETAVEKFLTVEQLPDIPLRRKSSLILADLRAIGESTNDLPVSEATLEITSPAAAFGVAYVLEGSTLGGKIIADILTRQTNGMLANSLSFFHGYGHKTMPMWLHFKDKLNQITDEQEQQAALYAADQTFKNFNLWINQYDAIEL